MFTNYGFLFTFDDRTVPFLGARMSSRHTASSHCACTCRKTKLKIIQANVSNFQLNVSLGVTKPLLHC